MKTLRGRLFAATLAALALTLALTIGIGAILTRQQVDKVQASGLARQADSAAKTRRQAVSYINNTQVSGGITTIVGYRPSFAGIVPDVNRSSNGSTTYQGKRYIYSYRTIPSRGLLLLRASSAKSAAWHPFLGDLLLAALAGAALAAVLSFLVARSIVRPVRRVADASHALAAGETPTPLPEEGAARARLARAGVQRDGAAARDLARQRAQLPALGQPRAEDAADRDPRLRRRARPRAPSRPTRPRRRSSSRRGGSSGSCATCSTSRG